DAIPGAPATLTRDRPLPAIWTAPDLLLAQTCGYPLTMDLREGVRLVATPLYDAPGCAGAWHRSAIVVRADDPAQALAACRGYRVAVNAPD
ncbi:phosphate ABC transporter substrate-binding protein, partial [Salmonella enterica]